MVVSDQKRYDEMSTDELFDILRREILAARLKVALDEELSRSSTPMQKRLASMSLPPENPTKPQPQGV